MLHRELLTRDKCVISICIGNTSNGKEAENTLNTIATLQGISRTLDRPVVASFYNNDDRTSRILVDQHIEDDVRVMALLLSGNNEELDSEDIHNFLYFTKKTGIPSQVADMKIYSKTADSTDPSGYVAIAVASILPSREDRQINLGQPYGCTGYMPVGVTEASSAIINPMHFILTNAYMNQRLEDYKAIVDQFKASMEQLSKTAILNIAEVSDGNGFVL